MTDILSRLVEIWSIRAPSLFSGGVKLQQAQLGQELFICPLQGLQGYLAYSVIVTLYKGSTTYDGLHSNIESSCTCEEL